MVESAKGQRCRDCRFLDVKPNAAGRRVVGRDRTYNCTAPIPEPELPDSVTSAFGWRWPPARSRMVGDDGAGCPMFTPLPAVSTKPTPEGGERGTARGHDLTAPPNLYSEDLF
jgi:hypothetical protein